VERALGPCRWGASQPGLGGWERRAKQGNGSAGKTGLTAWAHRSAGERATRTERAKDRRCVAGPRVGWSRAASERGARVWAGARLGQGREGGPGPLRGREKGRLDWAVGWERAQSEKREVRAEGSLVG
jgi:hypothetical protein